MKQNNTKQDMFIKYLNSVRKGLEEYLKSLDSLKGESFNLYFSGSTKCGLQTTSQTLKLVMSLRFRDENGRYIEDGPAKKVQEHKDSVLAKLKEQIENENYQKALQEGEDFIYLEENQSFYIVLSHIGIELSNPPI